MRNTTPDGQKLILGEHGIGDNRPVYVDQQGYLKSPFGKPELRADNRGWARWERVARNAKFTLGTDGNRQFRQAPWAVHLNGGEQSSGEDWASIWLPVNEIPLTEFTKFMWTYYKFLAGTAHVGAVGPNIVLCTRNPNDPDERAEISQQASHGQAITEGWHDDIVVPATTAYLFWYGNNITSDLTEGSVLYTLAQFQADKAFKNHVVYLIKIDYGFWGAARATGDAWIGSIQINGENITLEPTEAEKLEIAEFEKNMFGEPSLEANNNASACWAQGTVSPLDQKGATGWLANLYGGLQTGDDWARVVIPVNELPVPLFHTALWSYYMLAAQTMGVNMVLNVHDPLDFDKRAEITQLANVAGLEKAAGWNAHELNPTTDQFFYYGENIGNTNLVAFDGTPATLYGWDDFQGDEWFNGCTIYRITIEYGWEASGTFQDAWVADLKLNGHLILLKPDKGGSGRIAHRHFTVTTGDLTGTIAPKTPFRLLALDVHVSAIPDTGETLTLTKDAGQGELFDTVIFSDDLFIGSRTSLFVPLGVGYDFVAEDEIDLFQTNGSDDDWGVTIIYQTVLL